jgi:hypothetical protein
VGGGSSRLSLSRWASCPAAPPARPLRKSASKPWLAATPRSDDESRRDVSNWLVSRPARPPSSGGREKVMDVGAGAVAAWDEVGTCGGASAGDWLADVFGGPVERRLEGG